MMDGSGAQDEPPPDDVEGKPAMDGLSARQRMQAADSMNAKRAKDRDDFFARFPDAARINIDNSGSPAGAPQAIRMLRERRAFSSAFPTPRASGYFDGYATRSQFWSVIRRASHLPAPSFPRPVRGAICRWPRRLRSWRLNGFWNAPSKLDELRKAAVDAPRGCFAENFIASVNEGNPCNVETLERSRG
jgi:hypothetical protein